MCLFFKEMLRSRFTCPDNSFLRRTAFPSERFLRVTEPLSGWCLKHSSLLFNHMNKASVRINPSFWQQRLFDICDLPRISRSIPTVDFLIRRSGDTFPGACWHQRRKTSRSEKILFTSQRERERKETEDKERERKIIIIIFIPKKKIRINKKATSVLLFSTTNAVRVAQQTCPANRYHRSWIDWAIPQQGSGWAKHEKNTWDNSHGNTLSGRSFVALAENVALWQAVCFSSVRPAVFESCAGTLSCK